MKAVILAGGYGTRLGEETNVKPKPMIEIGGKPILWHIMKIYSAHNINDFVICSGYKGDIIKGWADKYNDNNTAWNVEVVDTGIDDVLLRSQSVFSLKDGKAVPHDKDGNVIYGEGTSEPMSVKEWVKGQMDVAPHLFKASQGGGSEHGKNFVVSGSKDLSALEKLQMGFAK